MVRYADDFVILCRTPDEAARALELVQTWVSAAGLTLHPTKTKVVEARTEGFDFLGYHFQGGSRWPREKSLRKFQDTIRAETKRTNGTSLPSIIAVLNPILRGWFAYFQHSRPWIFRRLDGWIRRRLRSCSKTGETPRPGPRLGSPPLAQRLLRRPGAFQSGASPCVGPSTLFEVKPSTGEPYAGDPPVRFGGRGEPSQWVLPTPTRLRRRLLNGRHQIVELLDPKHADVPHGSREPG